jgi:hypothetical protein
MSWNIKTPGDYINGPLTVAGVTQFNSNVGVGISPTSRLHIGNTAAATRLTITDDVANGRSGYIESNYSDALVIGTTSGVRAIRFSPDGKPYYQIATDGVQTWLDGVGGTRMTLNSFGFGIGESPNQKFSVLVADGAQAASFRAASGRLRIRPYVNAAYGCAIQATNVAENALQLLTLEGVSINLNTNGGTALSLNANGAAALMGASTTASGVGITFPAAQSASTDANTLDDYEEGTWTPIIVGVTTAGVGTYSARVARYTKVGNMVTCHCYMDWTAHTGVGEMQLAGLPFQTSSEASSHTAVAFGYVNGINLSANNTLYGWTIPGTNSFNFNQVPTGGGSMASVTIDTSAALIFTVSYRV